MVRSVRIKRRRAYASIENDDRYRRELLQLLHDEQLLAALSEDSELGAALPSFASGSLPQPVPTPTHNPNHLSPNLYSPRRDMDRVNRLARRSSVRNRSFATDLDSNLADGTSQGSVEFGAHFHRTRTRNLRKRMRIA